MVYYFNMMKQGICQYYFVIKEIKYNFANMKTTKEILNILARFKRDNENLGILSLGLFGSCARGEQKVTSDVDVCVKFEKADFIDFFNMKSKLSDIFGCRVDLVSMNKYLDPTFVESIAKDVIYV